MIRALFIIQCDICGDFFEELRQSNRPEPNDWALEAGSLQATATEEYGWFFNSKIRKHWCIDCLSELPPPQETNTDVDF